MHALRRALLWRRPLPQPPAAAPPRPLLSPRACLRSTRRVPIARSLLFIVVQHKPATVCILSHQRAGLCLLHEEPPVLTDATTSGNGSGLTVNSGDGFCLTVTPCKHMPILRREEDRATPDLATNHHAHCCRSGRQKCTCSCRPRAWCAVTHRHRAHPCRSDRRTCSCDSRRSARHAIAHHRPSRKPQPPSPALPPLRLCLRLSSCLHSHPRLGQNRCSCSSRFWAARAAAHTPVAGAAAACRYTFPSSRISRQLYAPS